MNSLALVALGMGLREQGQARMRTVRIVVTSSGEFTPANPLAPPDPLPQRPAAPLYQALLREGVIVRPIANYGLPNHLRVTVGTEAENQTFLRALDRVLAG